MDKEEKYQYWIDVAEYDLTTAEAMLRSGRYVNVAFMCQQSLEKFAKGLYNYYIGDNVPRVHNISHIFSKVLDDEAVRQNEKVFRLFDKLATYYIEGRYPTFRKKISATVDEKEARSILKQTKEAYKWMESLKK